MVNKTINILQTFQAMLCFWQQNTAIEYANAQNVNNAEWSKQTSTKSKTKQKETEIHR